jgi:hypothetical protein
MKAVEQDLAFKPTTYEAEFENAKQIIKRSRDLTTMMMEEHFIAEPPPDDGTHDIDLETIKSAY